VTPVSFCGGSMAWWLACELGVVRRADLVVPLVEVRRVARSGTTDLHG
jgi:hypothetical protein